MTYRIVREINAVVLYVPLDHASPGLHYRRPCRYAFSRTSFVNDFISRMFHDCCVVQPPATRFGARRSRWRAAALEWAYTNRLIPQREASA